MAISAWAASVWTRPGARGTELPNASIFDLAMISGIQQKAHVWLGKTPDHKEKTLIKDLLDRGDEKSLAGTFEVDRLSFGTAGLRGLMGPGPGQMNRLVVRETTAGLATHLIESDPRGKEDGVVIAYDGRHGSKVFAEDATGVLASYGIKVYLFDTYAPTPLCGFSVKKYNAAAGIVVTASHNPPKYNGYKVYWRGGNQINDPIDGYIAKAIDAVADSPQAPLCLSLADASEQGLLQMLGEETFSAYKQGVDASVSLPRIPERTTFRIAYTPLHGVGAPLAEALLKAAGFENVWTVQEQREPDGDFPTVAFPNPEEVGAMDLVKALADKHSCPIAVANDPDADRLAVCSRSTPMGPMRQLTGDQVGSLLGDELLRRAPKGAAVLSTIVSSRLLARLAKEYGAEHTETLTGFKWLGAVARRKENTFAFAYEEALGYMVGPLVWDKDGLSAIVLACELAAALSAEGLTLWDRLEEIHRRVGLSITTQRTIKLSAGMFGSDIMKRLRADLPTKVGKFNIEFVHDLLNNPSQPNGDGIPRNDVLRFYVSTPDVDGKDKEEVMLTAPRVIVRPSGTEPKVKIYCELLGKISEGEAYHVASKRSEDELEEIVEAFYEWMSR